MASYTVNPEGIEHAHRLIDGHQYVVQSRWTDAQPSADQENEYLERHGWPEYGAWHLATTDGASDETKARYAFVLGDFRRIHRMAIIACHYRAAEWGHKQIELAAHDLLQYLDDRRR